MKGILRFLTARKCHILWLTVSTICTLSAWNEKHDDSPLTWLYEYTQSTVFRNLIFISVLNHRTKRSSSKILAMERCSDQTMKGKKRIYYKKLKVYDVWETSAKIPCWWRVTSQIWVVFLIGRAAQEICFNQSETLPRISALVSQTSFHRESSGGVAKCWLFS